MTDEGKVVEYLLNFIWVPFVGWVMAMAGRHKQDNRDRDEKISGLQERTAVVEATRMTREDVTEVIETKFEKLEDKIDKLADNVNDLLRSIPKRSGD